MTDLVGKQEPRTITIRKDALDGLLNAAESVAAHLMRDVDYAIAVRDLEPLAYWLEVFSTGDADAG